MAKFIFNLMLRSELLIQIQKQDNLKDCAINLKVDTKTVWTELTKKSVYKPNKYLCNTCINRYKCTHYSIEITNNVKEDLIALKQCHLLEQELCPKLKHFPYVCNVCTNKTHCKLLKKYYDPKFAQELSDTLKRTPRKVLKLNNYQINTIDTMVSPRIKKGQSIHHIYVTCMYVKSLISEQTFKRYIYLGLFEAKAFNLPMKNRYDPVRKETIKRELLKNNWRKDNRSFADFIDFCEANKIEQDYWEYDSIEGKKKDKKMILTITYVEFDFQFGLVYEKNNYDDALEKIRELQRKLGEKFWEIFNVNLSDNGIEFDKFTDIEWDELTGEIKCKTFFTRPHVATDKADCENNHRLVRRILPKFESIEWLTQEQCNLVFSHVNALVRDSKNDKTPYELFVERFGKEVADLLGIFYVKPEDVCLKPFLLIK